MSGRVTTSDPFDEILYPSKTLSRSHPDSLATRGILRGMRPPPVECCRVLELGCGTGVNVVSLALSLPDSEFVGIDSAAVHIESGRSMIAECGLRNVQLRQLDIRQAGELGRFDYVIAHGVYSWVPAEVRDRLLAVCAATLTDNGIAFLS
jgi:trans-aconitate methyltransferase